ncbi:DUF1515 family protein [Agrobacterium larrymoorei]|uniref:ElaB/YqjD/DUF883 family membrane-anchored ribosome-binding protein n=1 Tax=Agrobacterium larrymoorei TaxID=160699 RepID=A0ABU0UF80_9HYPH|nr:DUF1515 family protein [Agrobacterium larrymoorei]MDQ1183597.1 ElaB/YqjD/DUF883 family membrane-anchored ribosome-binding protein [Agrobacterium larrymoorei]
MPPFEFDASLHQKIGEMLAMQVALKESVQRVEEQARRSEDKADESRAVVHRRLDEMVNRVGEVEQTVAIVKEDVTEMKPHTDDLKRWKLMGVGAFTMMGIGAMFLGVTFADVLKRIGTLIIGR